jgi:hypothetical protein
VILREAGTAPKCPYLICSKCAPDLSAGAS